MTYVPKEEREIREIVSAEIQLERSRQTAKWGRQYHVYPIWLGILMEEVGEVAQAVNTETVPVASKPTDADDLYKELIQVAAVAAAMAEQVIVDKRRGSLYGS